MIILRAMPNHRPVAITPDIYSWVGQSLSKVIQGASHWYNRGSLMNAKSIEDLMRILFNKKALFLRPSEFHVSAKKVVGVIASAS